MTRSEVKKQLEAFFRKLGITASFFEDKNFAKATIGEALIGFEFVENESVLKAQALIYRFRNAPNPIVIEALFAEQQNADTGGGKLNFDTGDFSLYLEKIFNEKISGEKFYEQLNHLAQTSLLWSSEILPQIAESVHSG
ncbi:MAG: hypothetical protein ABIP06_09130 [Pyrinomonadaceae bacterium]